MPQLATEWSWADDGLALTMKLRPGVVFHDGEPLDAEAVRFNLERNKTAAYSRRQSELKPVKGLVVVDPLTVRLELSEPYAPLMAQLADRAGMMVSPKAARELGEKMTNRPVCAGPYKFVEWVPQDRIVFERFERYWNAGAIHIDRVAYLPVPDDTVRLANLRSGSFQLTERIAPTDLATVRGDPRVRLYESPSVALPRAVDQRRRRGGKDAARLEPEAARGLRDVARSRGDQPGRLRRRVHPVEPAGGAGHALLRQGVPGAFARSCPRQGARRRERL